MNLPVAARKADFSEVEYVFLDRDGVINRKPPDSEYFTSWDSTHLLPGVEEAIALLNGSLRRVIVVTNQRGSHWDSCPKWPYAQFMRNCSPTSPHSARTLMLSITVRTIT